MTNKIETPQQLAAFEYWFANGQSFRETSQQFAIKSRTLYDWADRWNWEERARKRVDEASKLNDEAAIETIKEMQERHRRLGRALQAEVAEFLKRNKGQVVTDAQEAARLTDLGIKIERTSQGLPAWILEIMKMSDDELIKLYQEQLDQESNTG